jgi:hypothetical protein
MTRTVTCLAATLSFTVLAAPASAERSTIGDSWSLLDLDRSGGCELTIASAGKAMQLRASGLIPGEVYQFVLTNGDMKPVMFTGYADSRGGLVQYYHPFRFNRDGGTVRVSITAARCNLSAAAEWNRELVTIP